MNQIALAVLMLFFSAINIYAQDGSLAPVAWERFKITDMKVSMLLPKRPVVFHPKLFCSAREISSYFAYAENAVYEVSIVTKSDAASRCPAIGDFPKPKFNQATFDERLLKLRSDGTKFTEKTEQRAGKQSIRFSADNETRWIISDLSNDRWVELATFKRPGSSTEDDRFVDSLDLTGKDGKEIGDGTPVTLGDADFKARPLPSGEVTVLPPFIISKAPAEYTAAARKHEIRGSVVLNVELKANGSIGNINVAHGLDYGLTEQAIAAAKKIVFLPRTVNGIPVDSTIAFSFTFSGL